MGRNLSLKTRRRNAAGINKRLQGAWGRRVFISLGDGRRSTATLGTGNAQLAFDARVPGTGGNAISMTIANGGAAPVVTVVGSAITVTAPVASTTARDVRNAINFSPLANPLVWAYHPKGSDATAFVVAGTVTLSGGTAAG